jgi:hypothetical protein
MELYEYEDFTVINGFMEEGRKGYYSFRVKKFLKAGISKIV